jgi:hypothetical protein
MERNEHRDAYMFGGFVVLCITVVLVVIVAHDSWSQDAWIAIGAIGAAVQALVLVIGVPLAVRQLRETREASLRDQRFLLANDLDLAVFRRLLPAIRQHVANWRSALYHRTMAGNFAGTPLGEDYEKQYGDLLLLIRESGRLSIDESDAVQRLLARLGRPGNLEIWTLITALMRTPSFVPDAHVGQPHDPDPGGFVTAIEKAAAGLQRWVERFLAEVVGVPSPDVQREPAGTTPVER